MSNRLKNLSRHTDRRNGKRRALRLQAKQVRGR